MTLTVFYQGVYSSCLQVFDIQKQVWLPTGGLRFSIMEQGVQREAHHSVLVITPKTILSAFTKK